MGDCQVWNTWVNEHVLEESDNFYPSTNQEHFLDTEDRKSYNKDYVSSYQPSNNREPQKDDTIHSQCVKLSREDKALYGVCPPLENLVLVACQFCNSLVQQQELLRHTELLHCDVNWKRRFNQMTESVTSEDPVSRPSVSNNNSSSQNAKKVQGSSSSSSSSSKTSSKGKKNGSPHEHWTSSSAMTQQLNSRSSQNELRHFSTQHSKSNANSKDLSYTSKRPKETKSQSSKKRKKDKSTDYEKKSRPNSNQELYTNTTYLAHQNSGFKLVELLNLESSTYKQFEDGSRTSNSSASKSKKSSSNISGHQKTSERSSTSSQFSSRKSNSMLSGFPDYDPSVCGVLLEPGRICLQRCPCQHHGYLRPVPGYGSEDINIDRTRDCSSAQNSENWSMNGSNSSYSFDSYSYKATQQSHYSHQSATSMYTIEAAGTEHRPVAENCTKQSVSYSSTVMSNRRLQEPQSTDTFYIYSQKSDSEHEEEDITPDFSTDLPYINHFPRPSAICDFGLKITDNGVRTSNRQLDHLRSALRLLKTNLHKTDIHNRNFGSVCNSDPFSNSSDNRRMEGISDRLSNSVLCQYQTLSNSHDSSGRSSHSKPSSSSQKSSMKGRASKRKQSSNGVYDTNVLHISNLPNSVCNGDNPVFHSDGHFYPINGVNMHGLPFSSSRHEQDYVTNNSEYTREGFCYLPAPTDDSDKYNPGRSVHCTTSQGDGSTYSQLNGQQPLYLNDRRDMNNDDDINGLIHAHGHPITSGRHFSTGQVSFPMTTQESNDSGISSEGHHRPNLKQSYFGSSSLMNEDSQPKSRTYLLTKQLTPDLVRKNGMLNKESTLTSH